MTTLIHKTHGLHATAIIEPAVRGADEVNESGCTRHQRCSSPCGLWHPLASPTLLSHASAMVITIVFVQPTKLLQC